MGGSRFGKFFSFGPCFSYVVSVLRFFFKMGIFLHRLKSVWCSVLDYFLLKIKKIKALVKILLFLFVM